MLFLPFVFQIVFDLLLEEHSEARPLDHPLLPFGTFEFLADLHDIVEELLAELASDIVLYKLWQEVDTIINIEREFQVSNAIAYGLVVEDKILIVQGHVFFVQRSFYTKCFLQFRIIVDGTSVYENFVAFLQAEVGISLKVGLSLGNQGRVQKYIAYFIVSVDVFDHGRLFAVWKEIIVIIDLGENGGEVFKRDVQFAFNHRTDCVGLFPSGDFDSIFITLFDKWLPVNGIQVIENLLHFFLKSLDKRMIVRFNFVIRITLLQCLFSRAQKGKKVGLVQLSFLLDGSLCLLDFFDSIDCAIQLMVFIEMETFLEEMDECMQVSVLLFLLFFFFYDIFLFLEPLFLCSFLQRNFHLLLSQLGLYYVQRRPIRRNLRQCLQFIIQFDVLYAHFMLFL